MTAAEQSLSHLANGPTPIDGPSHKVIVHTGSKKLLVFFSGVSKSNGRFDFWNSATSQQENTILINNGKNEWYQRGIPDFSSDIQDTAKKIHSWAKHLKCNEIVTIGVSMGGYAAILFGSALDARVLALGFDSILQYPLSRSAARLSKGTPISQRELRPVVERSKCEITAITGDMDPSDLLSLSRISDLPNVRPIILRGVNHSVGRYINREYNLTKVIKDFVESNSLPDFLELGNSCLTNNIPELIFKAHQQYVIDNFDSALQITNQIIKDNPMSEAANFIAGMSHLGLKNYNASAGHLAITCALVPQFNTAQFHFAKSLRLSGRLEQAIQHFTRYISLMPNSVGARRNIAAILKLQGKPEASLEWSNIADEIDAINQEAEALKKATQLANKKQETRNKKHY